MNVDEFESLALPYLDSVYRFAMVLTREPHEATDLVLETFRRAMAEASSASMSQDEIRILLLRTLRAISRTHRPCLNRTAGTRTGPAGSSENRPGTAEDQAIRMVLEQFPEHFRSVLLLWSVEQLSYDEIAVIENIPRTLVQRRLHDSRDVIRNVMQQGQDTGRPSSGAARASA